jgi:hypothetical protein
MAITTKAGLLTALAGAQTIYLDKGSVPGSLSFWNTNFASTIGSGGAGVLAGTSTTAGVVPTSATAGFPYIRPIAAGKTAYLAGVNFQGTSQAMRLRLVDMLWKAGAYNFNDTVTLSGQPSFVSRLPGAQYAGRTELWFEAVTAFTGIPTLVVTYTNQDGVAGQTTTYTAPSSAPVANRLLQIPLAAGDTGIQKVESVTATVATVGTFNLLIVRPLWNGRVMGPSDFGSRYNLGPDKTGMPIVYDTCALFQMVQFDAGGNTLATSMALTVAEG